MTDAAMLLRLLFPGQSSPEGGHPMLMEEPFAIGVLIQVHQLEARLDLPADLLLQGMGELYAVIVFFQEGHERLVTEGIEGE